MRKLNFLLVCFAVLVSANHSLQGGMITYRYNGKVLGDSGIAGMNIGDDMSIEYTLDTSTPDTDSRTTRFYSTGILTSVIGKIGSKTFSLSTTDLNLVSSLDIRDNWDNSFDNYNAFARNTWFLSNPTANSIASGFTLYEMQTFLIDNTQTALNGLSAFPSSAPAPSAFDNKFLLIRFRDTNSNSPSFRNVIGSVDSLTAVNSTVPEPTSIALFGLGSLGIGVIARRRQRKQMEPSA